MNLSGVPGATVPIWMTIFLASMVSSVVGFAFSAIAGSILFHIDGSYLHAVATMLIASTSLQAYAVFYLRKSIDFKALIPFLAGGSVTLLLGVYVATHIKPESVLLGVGSFLVLYGLYTVRGKTLRLRANGIAGDVFAGAMGGITGPVAAFPGPFVSIWSGLKGWDKSMQRGVTQPYILIMQVLTLGILLGANKTHMAMEWSLLQYAVPAIAGAILGLKLFEKLTDRQFLQVIAIFLVLSGIAMVAKGLR